MGIFKQKPDKISDGKTKKKLRKGNFKRETESFQLATPNNVKRTNYVKAKVDLIQQTRKSSLCGNRDEMTNHIETE